MASKAHRTYFLGSQTFQRRTSGLESQMALCDRFCDSECRLYPGFGQYRYLLGWILRLIGRLRCQGVFFLLLRYTRQRKPRWIKFLQYITMVTDLHMWFLYLLFRFTGFWCFTHETLLFCCLWKSDYQCKLTVEGHEIRPSCWRQSFGKCFLYLMEFLQVHHFDSIILLT